MNCSFNASFRTIAVTLLLSTPALSFGDGFSGGFRDALGPRFNAAPNVRIAPTPRNHASPVDPYAALRYWNQIAINASGLDHTPVAPGETRIFGEQFGPGRASRAMAIVHIAIFDAVNAIAGRYNGYTSIAPASRDTASNAAIAEAANPERIGILELRRQH